MPMTITNIPTSFRENIYSVVIQALGYTNNKKEEKVQKQIRRWIDEELQQISQEIE
jgi:hypothetical protein